jgi:hypothetical protein
VKVLLVNVEKVVELPDGSHWASGCVACGARMRLMVVSDAMDSILIECIACRRDVAIDFLPAEGDAAGIPQDVARALDCIDRGEDEVGMHRKRVDAWRRGD